MRFQNKLLVARRRQLGDKLNFILPLKVLSFIVKLFCVNNTLNYIYQFLLWHLINWGFRTLHHLDEFNLFF